MTVDDLGGAPARPLYEERYLLLTRDNGELADRDVVR